MDPKQIAAFFAAPATGHGQPLTTAGSLANAQGGPATSVTIEEYQNYILNALQSKVVGSGNLTDVEATTYKPHWEGNLFLTQFKVTFYHDASNQQLLNLQFEYDHGKPNDKGQDFRLLWQSFYKLDGQTQSFDHLFLSGPIHDAFQNSIPPTDKIDPEAIARDFSVKFAGKCVGDGWNTWFLTSSSLRENSVRMNGDKITFSIDLTEWGGGKATLNVTYEYRGVNFNQDVFNLIGTQYMRDGKVVGDRIVQEHALFLDGDLASARIMHQYRAGAAAPTDVTPS
jgi:hypothetical protein